MKVTVKTTPRNYGPATSLVVVEEPGSIRLAARFSYPEDAEQAKWLLEEVIQELV